MTKYPSVLFHIPSLKVIQMDGNPIGQSENESGSVRPEISENGQKNFEESSDSGIASQEEEMSEKNQTENKKSESKCLTIELSLKSEEGKKRNVRF